MLWFYWVFHQPPRINHFIDTQIWFDIPFEGSFQSVLNFPLPIIDSNFYLIKPDYIPDSYKPEDPHIHTSSRLPHNCNNYIEFSDYKEIDGFDKQKKLLGIIVEEKDNPFEFLQKLSKIFFGEVSLPFFSIQVINNIFRYVNFFYEKFYIDDMTSEDAKIGILLLLFQSAFFVCGISQIMKNIEKFNKRIWNNFTKIFQFKYT